MAKKFKISHEEIDQIFADAMQQPGQGGSVIQQLNQAAQAMKMLPPGGGKPVAQA